MGGWEAGLVRTFTCFAAGSGSGEAFSCCLVYKFLAWYVLLVAGAVCVCV